MKRPSWTPVRIAISLIALIGAAMMIYLVYLHFAPDKQSFCDLGEEISCGLVNKSVYSEVFGIPISALGVVYFIGVLYVALFAFTPAYLQLLFYGTIIFLGPSLYLTWTEIYKIQSICILCEGSKALMVILKPSPSSPMRFSTGTRASWKLIQPVEPARTPSLP